MQSPTRPAHDAENAPATPPRTVITEPDFSRTPQPIGDLASRADFPQGTLGEYIDIKGFAGVVVEIIGQSIRVRSSEGITQRFNAGRLKLLFAPALRPDQESTPAEPSAPPRELVTDPDFSAPVRRISEYAGQSDFPRSTLGQHVDIEGYRGVVVEILQGSLKIQSVAGLTRSYNAEVLRKRHTKA